MSVNVIQSAGQGQGQVMKGHEWSLGVMIRARCYGTGLALPGPVRLTTGSPHLVTCSCCTVIGW